MFRKILQANDALERMRGTRTARIAHMAHCPVLIVR